MSGRPQSREGEPEREEARRTPTGVPTQVDPLERELRRMAVLHRRDVMAVRRSQSRRARAVHGLG